MLVYKKNKSSTCQQYFGTFYVLLDEMAKVKQEDTQTNDNTEDLDR